MIKRYLCLNLEMFGPMTARAGGCLEKRLVFADGKAAGGSSGSGAEGEKEKLTPENLEDRLVSMPDEGKLSEETVSEALELIEKGGDEAKAEIFKHAVKVDDGRMKENDFLRRIKLYKRKKQNPELDTEKDKEKKEAETAEKAERKEKINEESARIASISANTRRSVAEMMENARAMEESYMKREEIPEEMKRNFQNLKKEIEELNGMDKKNNEEYDGKIKTEADALAKDGKLSAKEAGELLELDGLEEGFKARFDGLTKKCTDEKSKAAVAKILELKKQQAEKNKKIEDDLRKKAAEFRKIMEHVGDGIMQKAMREKALKEMALSTGVNMAEGQELVYMGLKMDKEGNIKPTRESFRIKKIKFLDESSPLITIESNNPKTGEPVEEEITLAGFNRLIDARGATENIANLKELENSIGMPVQAGDTFTYLDQTQADSSLEIEEKKLKIESIDADKGQIVLSEDVKLAPQATPSRYLTYGEFAKWFKRGEAMKEITDISKLRAELIAHNEYLNAAYERKGANHPPIEVEVNEVLKYDDNSDRTFVIKEVGENGITLDNGRKYSLAGFLRWVKRNEVEKVTAESEAAQATEMSGDDAERERIMEEKKKEIDDRIAEAQKEAGTSEAHADSHGHAAPSVGYLKKLWADTKLISPYGLFEMGKTIVELIKRKMKRSEHDRVGTVGSQMFAPIWTELGAEFKGVAQHAENEEVDHHVKHYKTMGIEFVKHELHEAPTKDILKAAVTVLCEKGQMRWDDPVFWHSMNKYAYGRLKDENGETLWVNEKNYMYSIEKYMDAWWGNDTFREFRNKQDSSYNSIRSNFKDHAIRLEGDPDRNGGLRFALKKLLYQHIHGEHVNPAQYESYLHYAIQAGKLSFEDKLFFLMMGVGTSAPGAHGHPGQTLLHIDRVSALEGELLNNFPILDFLVSPFIPVVDENGNTVMENGKPKLDKPNVNNFRKWIKDYMEKDFGGPASSVMDPNKLGPGDNMKKFVYKVAVWDDWMRTRLHKSARNASNWDHDDMDVHAAFLTDEMVDQIVLKQGGATQQVSTPGLKNAIVGFNNFIKVKLDMLDEHKGAKNSVETQKDMRNIVDLIKSFTKLDAVLDDRYYHGGNYARFSQSDVHSFALADSARTVKTHIEETRNFIQRVSEILDAKTEGRYQLAATWKAVLRERTPDKQAQTNAVKDIGIKMDGALKELQAKGEDVTDIFLANKGMVKGIGHKAEKSADSEKENASVFEFQPYVNQELIGKIEEYKELNRKMGTSTMMTPEQVKEEESRRLKQIMNEYDSGHYAARPEDSKVLDNAIAAKKGEMAGKSGGEGGVPEKMKAGPAKKGK
jgi:hypothetical protein